jgi:cytoplasmic iron level regulating protein YaaA (DUF328/UPF0246 family)
MKKGSYIHKQNISLMLVLLSPAKKMDFDQQTNGLEYSQPVFQEESQQLINKLKSLSRKKIGQLMNISANLAELNHNRYHAWQLPFDTGNSRAAIFAFRGDVYLGLEADTLSKDDLAFAQEHVRILSGLHGVLKPLDLIQPHRLEMGTRLPVRRRRNLYDFWKDKINPHLKKELQETGQDVIVNLASNEYFKSVQADKLPVRVVTCHFREYREGEYKSLMLFVKQARGKMARYIIDHRLTDPEDLKGFDYDGYRFMESLSSEDDLYFVRG